MDRSRSPVKPLIDADTRIAFREIRTDDELRQSLAQRYRIYSEELELPHLQSLDHVTGLDLDAYDLTSRHFALFARNDAEERVVGTLRITGTRPGPLTGALHRIARGHASLAARLVAARTAPLPMLSFLAQAPAMQALYDEHVRRGEQVAEPGRLTLHPEMRAGVEWCGMRPSHFLILCAQAIAWNVASLDRVLMDCDSRLVPLYRHFGFWQVPGGEPVFQEQLGFNVAVLQATPLSLPRSLTPAVRHLALELRASGEAVLGPARAPASPPRAFIGVAASRPGDAPGISPSQAAGVSAAGQFQGPVAMNPAQ